MTSRDLFIRKQLLFNKGPYFAKKKNRIENNETFKEKIKQDI